MLQLILNLVLICVLWSLCRQYQKLLKKCELAEDRAAQWEYNFYQQMRAAENRVSDMLGAVEIRDEDKILNALELEK